MFRLFWSGLYNRDYWRRWPERFGFIQPVAGISPLIWIHAVSVGEVQAALPLVQRLQTAYPQYQFLVSTVTPTGSAMVRRKIGAEVMHTYFPYDLPGVVRRFLRRTRPAALIVLETEIWPNLYHYCRIQGIKLMLVNARLSEKSRNGYRKISRLTRQVLGNIDLIAAQSEADAKRFDELGAECTRLAVAGNLKFDVQMPGSVFEHGHTIRNFLNRNALVWIAASTHPGEEQVILAVQRQIVEENPDCLLILAPRHPERCGKVEELIAGCGFKYLCKSRLPELPVAGCSREIQVILLDTLGELPDFYAAADVAFVGGSLLPAYGGHNVLEPAALGVPVLTGKYTASFAEINRLLLEKQGEMRVDDSEQLADCLLQLMGDAGLRQRMGQAGRALIQEHQGSADRIMALIAGLLPPDESLVGMRD